LVARRSSMAPKASARVVEFGGVVEDEAGVDVAGQDMPEQVGDEVGAGATPALVPTFAPAQRLVVELLVLHPDSAAHAAGADEDAGCSLVGLVGAVAHRGGANARAVREPETTATASSPRSSTMSVALNSWASAYRSA
jgi:hypothetical protein